MERYDWATSDPAKLPEKRIAELTAPDLFLLPMQVEKIDRPITLAGLYEAFPDGMDWITHAQPGAVAGVPAYERDQRTMIRAISDARDNAALAALAARGQASDHGR